MRSGTWRRLLEGEHLALTAWGHNEGRFRLTWTFWNGNRLCVTYGDDGGTAYEDDLSGASLVIFDE
jgi:hypothetical protein